MPAGKSYAKLWLNSYIALLLLKTKNSIRKNYLLLRKEGHPGEPQVVRINHNVLDERVGRTAMLKIRRKSKVTCMGIKLYL